MLKLFFEGLYTKNSVWRYEDEIRSITLISDKTNNNLRKIITNNISAIYFGNKMTKVTKNTIIELLPLDTYFRKLRIYEMINDISEFKITPLLVK